MSTVKKKLSLLPGGTVPGTGEDDRVEVLDALAWRGERMTFEILISMRHEPIASEVYLQKIGTMEVDDRRRDRGARDISELPMNEYSGGGES